VRVISEEMVLLAKASVRPEGTLSEEVTTVTACVCRHGGVGIGERFSFSRARAQVRPRIEPVVSFPTDQTEEEAFHE
jgi:hypothetical protein